MTLQKIVFFCLILLSLLACGHGSSSSVLDLDPEGVDSGTLGLDASEHSGDRDGGNGHDAGQEEGEPDASPALPSCSNDVRDGDESDVDCGGTCAPCALGNLCQKPGDCASGVCGDEGRCIEPSLTCFNRVQDEDESDVDCGGMSLCPRCADGKHCDQGADCQGGICNTNGWCESLSCENGKLDLGETDIDCGGLFCDPCTLGKSCNSDSDCVSMVCTDGLCHPQSCADGRHNQDESDVDCGGSCANKCDKSQTCLVEGDCAQGLSCIENICVDLNDETSADARVQNKHDIAYAYLLDTSGKWMINGGGTFALGRRLLESQYVSIHAALRFTNVYIPPKATIRSAHIHWYPHNEVDSSTRLRQNIYAEKVGNSLPFDLSNYESGRPDQRSKTTASIQDWVVRCNASCTEEFGANWEYDCPQRKLDCWNRDVEYGVPKDLSALVQEVVDLPDWASGNALTFFFINGTIYSDDHASYNGYRTATGYDPDDRGAQFAPRLAIEFDPP